MTKLQMVVAVADVAKVSKKEVKAVLEAFNTVIIRDLKKGNKVKLHGLGIMSVKQRKARVGRNPKTGETIQIPAKKVVKFRIAKSVKVQVL